MLNLLPSLQPHLSAARWVVAYSGGVDSHVLLHYLVKLAQTEKCPPITALHIHHGLQNDADAWQNHCQQVCAELGVGFAASVVAVDAASNVEENARSARYQVFTDFLQTGDVLLQGHHGDDQAETVLMRLLSGAGPQGLAGIPAQRKLGLGQLLRPMLTLSKTDILAYAQQYKLQWVEDGSNDNTDFDRNFLRQQILPQLKQRWPELTKTVSRSARLSGELSAELTEQAKGYLAKCDFQTDDLSIDLEALQQLSLAQRQLALRQYIARAGIKPPSHAVLQQCELLIFAGKDTQPQVQLADLFMRRFAGRLMLVADTVKIDSEVEYSWDGIDALSLGGERQLSVSPTEGGGLKPFTHAVVKYRRGGERCRPLGRQYSQSLKKLLQEYGVEPWQRDSVPLLYINDQLAAVGDYWVCADFASAEGEGWAIIWQR